DNSARDFDEIDEPLKLDWRAVQSVGMPNDESLSFAVLQGIQHRLVAWSSSAAISADVVVDEHFGHGPSVPFTERPTVALLTIHAKCLRRGVSRDPAVDSCSHCYYLNRRLYWPTSRACKPELSASIDPRSTSASSSRASYAWRQT